MMYPAYVEYIIKSYPTKLISRAQLKLEANKHLMKEAIIQEEDEEGYIDSNSLVNEELSKMDITPMKHPAIYVVTPR